MILIELIKYIIGVTLLMYLPAEGIFSFGRLDVSGWKRIALVSICGVVLLTFAEYGLSLLKLRYAVFPFVLILSGIGLWRRSAWIKYIQRDWSGPHWILFIFALLYSLSVTGSGWITKEGLILRGINASDGIWNVALISELEEMIPPEHPGINGVPLKGYHVFYNLWVSSIARFTSLDRVSLHFQYIPMTMSLLLVYILYVIGKQLSKNSYAALWSTGIALFGGSFSYVLPLFYHEKVSWDDAFGITQPGSLLLSPSFVSSLIIFIAAIVLLDEYIRRPYPITGFFLSLLAGIAVGFKVYAGMILLPIIFVMTIYVWVVQKKHHMIFILIGSMFIALLVFYPFNANYGFLLYQPLWPPHRIMQGTLGFTNWELKRQTLTQLGSFFGLIKLEIIAFTVFFFGNLGTRIIGFIGIKKFSFSQMSYIHTFLWLAVGISFIVPMFFIQPIGAFNMIQFFWYYLVFVGILSGWGIYEFLQRFSKVPRYIIASLIILITIPSATEKILAYFPFSPTHITISSSELSLYDVMQKTGSYNDAVLIVPSLPEYSKAELSRWFWGSSPPKVSAFGHKRVFLGNEVVQFPYEEWIGPRITLLTSLMGPQTKTNISEEEILEARNSLKTLIDSYKIRFILSHVPSLWFTSKFGLKELITKDGLSLYEVRPL